MIVPSYNEESRLPNMMNQTLNYLKDRAAEFGNVEIIMVDDGSKDKTFEVMKEYSQKTEFGKHIFIRGI
jgi:dolichyl-phosphate beta-glucosyltransferase